MDPELALRSTNRKFEERFRLIEAKLEAQDRSLSDTSMEEMETLWQEAKSQQKSTQRRKDAEAPRKDKS